MSREKQITDALTELSLGTRTVDLKRIQNAVESKSKERLPDNWEQIARQVLRTLSGLGLVKAQGDENSRLSYEAVELTEAFFSTESVTAAHLEHQANEEHQDPSASNENAERPSPTKRTSDASDHGGRNGGDGGDDRGGSDDGDGGGDGFREVLAHPFLFSLSETDFDLILNEI